MGSYLSTQEKLRRYYILTSLFYAVLSFVGMLFLYLTCRGFACLGIALLAFSIPIAILLFGIGTYIGSNMVDTHVT